MRVSTSVGLVAALSACGTTTSTPSHPTTTSVAVPSETSTSKLPGPCVDAERDGLKRLGPDAQPEGVRVVRQFDLDGDGTVDPFVTHELFCGTGGCDWQLYVQRGACAHHVGDLFVVLPLVGAKKSHGLFDLEGNVRQGCGGLARTDVVAAFDGARYRIVKERRCACPDEDHPGTPDPDEKCEEWHAATGKKP